MSRMHVEDSVCCLVHSKCLMEALIITMMQKCHNISHAPHFLLQLSLYFKREGEGDREGERESTNMLTWKGTCALKLTSIICLETAKPLG